jgi:hypothetical protein
VFVEMSSGAKRALDRDRRDSVFSRARYRTLDFLPISRADWMRIAHSLRMSVADFWISKSRALNNSASGGVEGSIRFRIYRRAVATNSKLMAWGSHSPCGHHDYTTLISNGELI